MCEAFLIGLWSIPEVHFNNLNLKAETDHQKQLVSQQREHGCDYKKLT